MYSNGIIDWQCSHVFPRIKRLRLGRSNEQLLDRRPFDGDLAGGPIIFTSSVVYCFDSKHHTIKQNFPITLAISSANDALYEYDAG